MTTTSWTTTGDVPANAWAALVSDIRRVLAVSAGTGSTVTGPTGAGQPLLTDEQIAFRVLAASEGATPLTVTFQRGAGTGEVTTTSPLAGGLVLTTLHRAARHWGALLSWTTDADVTTGAVALTLVEGLFGVGDRALSGQPGLSAESQVSQIVAGALGRVLGGEQSAAPDTLLADVIADLNAVLAGVRAAEQLLGGPA